MRLRSQTGCERRQGLPRLTRVAGSLRGPGSRSTTPFGRYGAADVGQGLLFVHVAFHSGVACPESHKTWRARWLAGVSAILVLASGDPI